MTKFRPAAGTADFKAMMKLVFELPDREALVKYLMDEYAFCGPTEENIKVRWYYYDERNAWNTHLVTIDGSAILFCDGMVY